MITMTSSEQTVPMEGKIVESTHQNSPSVTLEQWRNRPGRISRTKKKEGQEDNPKVDLKAILPPPDVFPSDDDVHNPKSGAYFDGDTPPRKNKRKIKSIITPQDNEIGTDKIIESALAATVQDKLFPDIFAPPSLDDSFSSYDANEPGKSPGNLSKDISEAFKGMNI